MKTINLFNVAKLVFGSLLLFALVYAFLNGDINGFSNTYLG